MNAPTNIQTINGPDGKPAFVVIPYAEYIAQHARDNDLIPHEVVRRTLANNIPPARAWREHLGLTQAEVAERLQQIVGHIGVRLIDLIEQHDHTRCRRVGRCRSR